MKTISLPCFIVVFALSLFCIMSCQKDDAGNTPLPDPPTDTIPVTPPPAGDSINVLVSLKTRMGGNCNFTYDEQLKRYTCFSNIFSPSNYDSTYIYYNANGNVSYTLNATPPSPIYTRTVSPIVFQYGSNSKLERVYKKKDIVATATAAQITDVSNPYNTMSYDSITYDVKGRISGTYTIYPEFNWNVNYLLAYNRFYYSATNDTLLDKIERYERNPSTVMILSYTQTFNNYDGKTNPAFRLMGFYGLLGVANVMVFDLHPSGIGGYLRSFLTATPQNCTSLRYHDPNSPPDNVTNVIYTYNSEGLPLRATNPGDLPDYVQYGYKKYKR